MTKKKINNKLIEAFWRISLLKPFLWLERKIRQGLKKRIKQIQQETKSKKYYHDIVKECKKYD